MRTLSILVMLLATTALARAEDAAPSRIDSITKSARDMMPTMPALPSVSLPSMPDLIFAGFFRRNRIEVEWRVGPCKGEFHSGEGSQQRCVGVRTHYKRSNSEAHSKYNEDGNSLS
jgi:hypothetical protein